MRDLVPFPSIWQGPDSGVGALPMPGKARPGQGDGGARLRAAVEAHVTRHLGAPELVLCEEVSQVVELEVLCMAPRGERDYWVLVTNGMSALPMTVPEEAAKFARAELMMCLPKEWKLTLESFTDERVYWPIRLLKSLARFPHLYKTWFGYGHTIPHKGEFPQAYAEGVPFCCAVLGHPSALPAGIKKLSKEGHEVNFYSVYPLYREEMNFKLKKGADPLFKKLKKRKISELVDLGRDVVCSSKR